MLAIDSPFVSKMEIVPASFVALKNRDHFSEVDRDKLPVLLLRFPIVASELSVLR